MASPPKRHTPRSALRVIREQHHLPRDTFRPEFSHQLPLTENRTRGQTYELIGEALLLKHLQIRGENPATMQPHLQRQARLPTPHGLRIADFFLPPVGLLVEVKSGPLRWDASVRHQVEKDAWLLQHHPEIKEIIWFLFHGASPRTLDGLHTAGIIGADLGFGLPEGSSPAVPRL